VGETLTLLDPPLARHLGKAAITENVYKHQGIATRNPRQTPTFLFIPRNELF
jgi:hypothetical protein